MLKGRDCVATKSVLKNIDVKTPAAARALVNALEDAKGKHARPVINNPSFSDASRDEIRTMFIARTDLPIYDYDERFDVLYIALGDRNNSYGDDSENGMVYLKDIDTDELTGITILGFIRRYQSNTLPLLPPQCKFTYDELRKRIKH